jgi:hypothetical protein
MDPKSAPRYQCTDATHHTAHAFQLAVGEQTANVGASLKPALGRNSQERAGLKPAPTLNRATILADTMILRQSLHHRATFRGSYGTMTVLKLTIMPWSGPHPLAWNRRRLGRPLPGSKIGVLGSFRFHGFAPVAIIGTPTRGSESLLPTRK